MTHHACDVARVFAGIAIFFNKSKVNNHETNKTKNRKSKR
jgi:hypothetical protein